MSARQIQALLREGARLRAALDAALRNERQITTADMRKRVR